MDFEKTFLNFKKFINYKIFFWVTKKNSNSPKKPISPPPPPLPTKKKGQVLTKVLLKLYSKFILYVFLTIKLQCQQKISQKYSLNIATTCHNTDHLCHPPSPPTRPAV